MRSLGDTAAASLKVCSSGSSAAGHPSGLSTRMTGVSQPTRTTGREQVNRCTGRLLLSARCVFVHPMDAGSPPLLHSPTGCSRKSGLPPVTQPVGRSTGWPSHHLQPTERAAQRFYTFRINLWGEESGGRWAQVVEKKGKKVVKTSRTAFRES